MEISIIIPSYNEGQNVVNITDRITAALQPLSLQYEILFIDDSKDNTTQLLETLSKTRENVRYIHRTTERGLGTAVVTGFKEARGEQFIVMDADLQHPPELLPKVIAALSSHDIVIPSRFIPGGSDGGLNTFRKLVSWTARKIGQFAIKRFRSITDCTSGFFGLHKKVITDVTLNPDSWKILMELLVKGNYQTIVEIPYQFMARDLGNSKMNAKEQWLYLLHVLKLVWSSPSDRRFYLFCFVGVAGVLVNLLFFHCFLYFNWHPLSASVLASLIAMVHNFLWHDNMTWKEFKNPNKIKRFLQLPQFIVVSLIGIAITALTVTGFMQLDISVSLGQLTGIALATFWNYFANQKWTWKKVNQ